LQSLRLAVVAGRLAFCLFRVDHVRAVGAAARGTNEALDRSLAYRERFPEPGAEMQNKLLIVIVRQI